VVTIQDDGQEGRGASLTPSGIALVARHRPIGPSNQPPQAAVVAELRMFDDALAEPSGA